MDLHRRGKTVYAPFGRMVEAHQFASVAEAKARHAFVAEALTWIGTPFVNHADVKGPGGAVDCAMLLTRCAVDSGLVAPFDPRPYPVHWNEHQDEERFVDFLTERLGAHEVHAPRFGDVAVWKFGRTFAHGGVIVNSAEVVHAWFGHRQVQRTRMDEPALAHMQVMGTAVPRPVRWFDLWSARAPARGAG